MKLPEPNLEIDPMHLDQACHEQFKLRLLWGKKQAIAQRELDEAESQLDVVSANVLSDVRKNPSKYGLEKFTDKGGETAMKASDAYQEAKDDVRAAKYQRDVVNAVVQAVEHRKRSVTLLVELLQIDYYSDPKMPAAMREEADLLNRKASRERKRKRAKQDA